MRSAAQSPWPSREDREEERRQKRNAVLVTAVQLFNERGFSATSLTDVAGRLNVTKPIIYRHFSSKDQILFECVRMGLEQVREAASAVAHSPGNGVNRLVAFLRRYAEIMTKDFGMCVIRTGDHELSAESRLEFRALKGEIDATIRKILDEGIADGSIVTSDVRLAAFAATGALNWIARWYDPDGPNTPEEISHFFVDFILRGIEARHVGSTADLS